MNARPIRLVHVINSLEFGGAEAMLGSLVERADRSRFDLAVVALIDDMAMARAIEAAGVPIRCVGMRPGVPDPRGLLRLSRFLSRFRPDVVQTWMDHSNLVGGLAARLGSRAAVVWGIHHGYHVPGQTKATTWLAIRAGARLSRRVPDVIQCCSVAARDYYKGLGFHPDSMTVIPNGFDTRRFRPDPEAGRSVRRELGIAADATLVGIVGRCMPQKDHPTFFRAAAAVAARFPGAHFLACGINADPSNRELVGLVEGLGLAGRTTLAGARHDMPAVHAALDLCVLSSVSEAFPLVLGEAMACGVPCVATDVGDSALMVGREGRIVPPRDHEALAVAIGEMLAMPAEGRRRLGLAARRRVVAEYDLGAIARRFESLYEGLARRSPARPDVEGPELLTPAVH